MDDLVGLWFVWVILSLLVIAIGLVGGLVTLLLNANRQPLAQYASQKWWWAALFGGISFLVAGGVCYSMLVGIGSH